jgi:hypothetical protein
MILNNLSAICPFAQIVWGKKEKKKKKKKIGGSSSSKNKKLIHLHVFHC